MAVNQTDALTDLSYLLGESSVPTSGIDDRKTFLQRALERVYRLYDFPTNDVTATFSFVNGAATLPTNVRQDGIHDIRIINSGTGDDLVFQPTPYSELDGYSAGNYRYRITGSEGAFVLTSSEATNNSVGTIRYVTTAPIINASIAAPLPQGSSMLLARGAMIYIRQSEDPQADITQEEELFQLELDEIIAAYNRNKPPVRGKSVYEAMGTYLGDIDRGY